MSIRKFISKFDKVVYHKIITFFLFLLISGTWAYFYYYITLEKHIKAVARKKINFGKYLLKKEFEHDINLISYLATLKSKKELKILCFMHDFLYALLEVDEKGHVNKFYTIKKLKHNIDLNLLKKKIAFLKFYKKEIDSHLIFISPIYPNFLGYQNVFIVGLPYLNSKKSKYLFAIFDASQSGLLKKAYFYLFSNIDKSLYLNYKFEYDYFDEPGIDAINIKYSIDYKYLGLAALRRALYLSLFFVLFYVFITSADFLFASRNLLKDAFTLLKFIEEGTYDCSKLNFKFSKELCEKISKIFNELLSKNREIDLLVDSLNLIVKENKDIKGMLKDITSLLKILIPCNEIYIGIYDTSKGMSIFSGNTFEIIKEDVFEKVKEILKDKDVVEEKNKIYLKFFYKPFEIFYIFSNCKKNCDIQKLKDLLDIINLIILTALKLYTNSIQDPLTGAFNREKLIYDLTESLEIYKRYKEPFSIIMLDIDHFKKINDTYGHDAGDLVLKSLVKTIKGFLRKGDVIYRYGGEEFLILLPRTTLENATKIAEKLREKISYIRVPYRNTTITFTASFGVTQVKDNDTINSLIKRADVALYEAKNKGRNRVEYVE